MESSNPNHPSVDQAENAVISDVDLFRPTGNRGNHHTYLVTRETPHCEHNQYVLPFGEMQNISDTK